MTVRIVQETPQALGRLGEVPIGFEVKSRFRVEPIDGSLGGWTLTEKPVDPPYWKDYDADEGEGPSRWLHRWDTSNWEVFSAYDRDTLVGDAVVAWNTPALSMLEARTDLAALWDIRVLPDVRR